MKTRSVIFNAGLNIKAHNAALVIPINADSKLGLPKNPNTRLYGLLQSNGSKLKN